MSNFTKIRLLNGIRLVLIVMPAINYKAKLYDSMLIQSLFDCFETWCIAPGKTDSVSRKTACLPIHLIVSPLLFIVGIEWSFC